ncbi:MAG TPA: Rrf2 family transcriptional regulator [Elusimicrobiales bacterium]|nr:Rrf2 family transcriptional regulator [Elusimicrobiales bacterium]
MKLLTKNTDYAVRALVYCALQKKGRFIPSLEIAQAQGIPLSFLRLLLQKLIRAGFLHAREGKEGGVQLAKPAAAISVLSIMKLLQGEVRLSECLFRKRLCPARATCVLRHKITALESKLAKEFEDITIAGLAYEIEGKRA